MYQDLSIVIPVYNEGKTLKKLISGITDKYKLAEIIIVNDGSNDDSNSIINNLQKNENFLHIENIKNRGYGYSLKVGVREATRKFIIFFDSDSQFEIENIKLFYDQIKMHNLDAVIGQRKYKEKQKFSKILNRNILRYSVKLITGFNLNDVNCGLRIFKNSFIKSIISFLPNGFSASTTTTTYSLILPIKLKYIDVDTLERVEGSYSKVNILKDGFKNALNFFKLIINFFSFKLYLSFSLFFFAISIIYSLYIALRDGLGIPIAGLIFFIISIFIFFIGLILEQISNLRLQIIQNNFLKNLDS